MENKKISFGFMKTKKQDKPIVTEQREYIESVEGNSIKVIGKEVSNEVAPLIIPMKPNTLITAERLKEIAEKVESFLNEPELGNQSKNLNEVQQHSENETIEQMAVRELLQESHQDKKPETQSHKILVTSNPVMDGQKESSLDDYESVPIQEFGMAMLRGMGWTPGKEGSKYKPPQLRPKGLGLGADKVVADNQKKNKSKDEEKDLVIVKNAYVKITTGKFSGYYGKVVSLDEDNGRVVVNIAVKKETVSLSEFMMQPVTKSEFDKQSKVINADTYEAYKNNERSTQKTSDCNSSKESSSSHKLIDNNCRKERKTDARSQSQTEKKKYSNGKSKDKSHRQKRDSSYSEEDSPRPKRTETKKHSSNESLDSYDEDKRRKKEYEQHSSSDSEKSYQRSRESGHKSSTKKKRDIDKKRKGKKKKRDRDRSPSHRKHRK